MELDFASQDPAVRFWAVFSSALLGVMAVAAGVALSVAERVAVDFDTELPRHFEWVSALGLWAIAGVWVGYMVALVVLLGYERSTKRDSAVLVVFMVCAFYLFMVVVGSGLPFINGMKSIM